MYKLLRKNKSNSSPRVINRLRANIVFANNMIKQVTSPEAKIHYKSLLAEFEKELQSLQLSQG